MDAGASRFVYPARPHVEAEPADVAATRADAGVDVVSLLIQTQERERRRIADDIHDDSLQVLSAVLLGLHQLRSHVEAPRALAIVERLEEDVELAARRLRWLMFDLQPRALEKEGLVPALRSYLAAMAGDTGISFDLVADAELEEPPPRTRTILYRITQEALANARKHSRARHVRVSIEPADGGFLTTVADDGVGLADAVANAGPLHVGLEAMRERAEMAGGWFDAAGSTGSGTTVRFWVPGHA
ncbi:MAG TPA: sensor histidine kinase [Actinomycetota bacterium]|nr:sensor histidine kinase [Actinomycetota bacterium]